MEEEEKGERDKTDTPPLDQWAREDAITDWE
jgi:hypothetical protein